MADLLKAAKDPKFREDVIRGLGETFSRGVAGVLGAPVDLTTMAMRPFGYNVPAEQVVGGSEYIGRQMEEAGLISSARNPVAEFLAGVAIPDPMDAAKLGAMFIGPIARVWDADAAARAAKMEAEGFDPRTIWSETGTWRGPDNKWRQEISDVDSKAIQQTGKELEYLQESSSAYPSELGKAFSHEELYKAYPDLQTMRAVMTGNSGGVYAEPTQISRERVEIPMRHSRATGEIIDPEYAKSATLHEAQHAIQQREGFARGGSPGMGLFDPELQKKINAKIEKLPEKKKNDPKEIEKIQDKITSDWYMKLAGEAEARATQARMGMTAAERRAKFPEESYDVPIKKLIVPDYEKIRANIPKSVTVKGK